jgi:Putative transposase
MKWVVYAKRPFAGLQQVLDYVGRYTHRVAISNNRLLDIEAGQVWFQWKDHRDCGCETQTRNTSPRTTLFLSGSSSQRAKTKKLHASHQRVDVWYF